MSANMKLKAWSVIVGVSIFASTLWAAESGKIEIHDRVGNGWHMYTTAYVNEYGEVSGTTTLKNCNNFRGFTGGLFVVVVDENLNPIYSTPVHKWGINASFFKKKRTRTATWYEKIPQEYFEQAASLAIVQQHTPTNRVWVWIRENKDIIVQNALMFIDLFQKINNKELSEDDIYNAVSNVVALLDTVDSDVWFLDNISAIHQLTLDVIALTKEEDGWVPENTDEAQMLVQAIINLTKQDLDWEDVDEIKGLVKDLISLMTDKDGWVPENLAEVQRIVEKMYELAYDQPIPDKVRNVIEKVIAGLDKLNS